MTDLQNFITKHLPINDEKYNLLISDDGLDGYKLVNSIHGNVVLLYKEKNIMSLRGDIKSEIIPELNNLKIGGKNKSRRNKSRRNTKNKKSRRNRKTSHR